MYVDFLVDGGAERTLSFRCNVYEVLDGDTLTQLCIADLSCEESRSPIGLRAHKSYLVIRRVDESLIRNGKEISLVELSHGQRPIEGPIISQHARVVCLCRCDVVTVCDRNAAPSARIIGHSWGREKHHGVANVSGGNRPNIGSVGNLYWQFGGMRICEVHRPKCAWEHL